MIFLHEPLHRALISKGEISPRSRGNSNGAENYCFTCKLSERIESIPTRVPT